MDSNLNAAVWAHLLRGTSLEELALTKRNDRIVLSGLQSSTPKEAERIRLLGADVSRISGLTVVSGVAWDSLDFTGSTLEGLRFFDSIIRNCIFDECDCQDWRLWGTRVENCSFRSADFRNSSLGGIRNNKRNTFDRVQFARTDLRRTNYISASFAHCAFRDSRLDKVNFQGSTFTDCTFEGELLEVCFNRSAFRQDELPPNCMSRVDFSRADLRSVEFRNLDLDEVCFPSDEKHILVYDYPQTLDTVLQFLQSRGDNASRSLAAYLGVYRRWAGPKQKRGILNEIDLREIGGKSVLEAVLAMIQEKKG
jgi:uncharacterized protein YjbI with pentapeptide repeats